MFDVLKKQWRIYAIEAWCLGTFMVSACVFGVLLFNPKSPTAALSFAVRNALMGFAMGLTAIAIIKSPWGRRSGAHFNPAVTLAFLRLGRIGRTDAAFYILFHFAGGATGVFLSWLMLGDLLADSAVRFVVTVPGENGIAAAFVAEWLISFTMMTTILFAASTQRLERLTPYFAGSVLASAITVAAPISGVSLNPARTFASAIVASDWSALWIYFTAPVTAMFVASELFVRVRGFKSTGVEFCKRAEDHA